MDFMGLAREINRAARHRQAHDRGSRLYGQSTARATFEGLDARA
jgi:hypothetical protein